jgi:hypothetical protein
VRVRISAAEMAGFSPLSQPSPTRGEGEPGLLINRVANSIDLPPRREEGGLKLSYLPQSAEGEGIFIPSADTA